MKFKSIFDRSRFKSNSEEAQSGHLTETERMELEGIQPDLEKKVIIKDDTFIKEYAAEKSDVTERIDIEVVPEKGVLKTENLVKKYGKRTVANNVSINMQYIQRNVIDCLNSWK